MQTTPREEVECHWRFKQGFSEKDMERSAKKEHDQTTNQGTLPNNEHDQIIKYEI